MATDRTGITNKHEWPRELQAVVVVVALSLSRRVLTFISFIRNV